MKKRFKILSSVPTIEEVYDWIRQVTRERDIDLEDYNNQVSTNVTYYNYTPSSSTDLIGTEKAGDIAVSTSYLYVVVDNAGTLRWQRVATATF